MDLMTKKLLVLLTVLLPWAGGLNAQSISELEYLNRALTTSPAADAARLETNRSRKLEGTAYSLANPTVNMESPSGAIYAVGVMQSLWLPGYYQRQRNVLRSQTGIAEAQATLTRTEVLLRARQLYLTAQYYQALDSLLTFQDSLYRSVSAATGRLRQAGQLDALQAGFAATQAEEVSVARTSNASALVSALEQMRVFAGLPGVLRVRSINLVDTMTMGSVVSRHLAPGVAYASRQVSLSQSQIRLEQARFKPSFSVGYLNQGLRETPNYLRYRASLDIPVWTRQYRSGIAAARIGEQAARRNLDAQRLTFQVDSTQLVSTRLRTLASIRRYQRVLLPQSDNIISMAMRLRAAGQVDVINHLRTVNEAFGIKLRYLELLRTLRETYINALALQGQP